MRIAVTSTVLMDVPDGERADEIRTRLIAAHEFAIRNRTPMTTTSGQDYTLVAIERLDVKERRV